MSSFYLKVISPNSLLFDDEITSLVVPGKDGKLGILANHSPLISSLKQGKVIISKVDNTSQEIEIPSGVLEVKNNKAVLLVS